jgi:hypothetical protein
MTEIEALKNVTVHLDSATALQIADRYIMFKYIEHWTSWTLMTALIVMIFLGARYFIKHIDDLV